MNKEYNEAIEWIHSRFQFGIKPGLERMNCMLEKLDHPERRLKCIHLAGTNGKGSTLSYMSYILQEAGYKVGTFTSPYIEQFNERISVNGQPISDQELVALVEVIKPVVDSMEDEVTEFEVITVMAIYYFAVMNPMEIALFETGLGGRYDSTNVIHPILTLITNVGQDHQAILGEELTQIAYEKGGIIKGGVPVITGVEQEDALQVIQDIAKEKKVRFYTLGKEFQGIPLSSTEEGEDFGFTCSIRSFEKLSITMKGQHQVKNASLAVMAMAYLKSYYSLLVDDVHIVDGLKKAFWLGRFEEMQHKPLVIIDGAHNPEGVESLVNTIKSRYAGKKVTVMFSAVSDKKIDNMVSQLEEVADELLFTTFDFPRALPANVLAESCNMEHKVYQSYEEGITATLAKMNEDNVFIITGSLYFISEVRSYFKS